MNAREKILAKIRHSLQRDDLTIEQVQIMRNRYTEQPRGILPDRAKITKDELITLFVDRAQQASAIVETVTNFKAAPAKIAALLTQEELTGGICIASDPDLKLLSWGHNLSVRYGAADQNDQVSVTKCLCGVAETGTLVLISSQQSPTTLNFLPAVHIVLLATEDIVSYYEDAWDLIRAMSHLPRTVNFITGPSRTGDIEQKIQVGIHGPKKLCILLYKKDSIL